MLGTVQAPERFNRLAWGPKVPDALAHPVGEEQTGGVYQLSADRRPCMHLADFSTDSYRSMVFWLEAWQMGQW